MKNLSIMEQKQIVGGGFKVKSYKYSSGTLYNNVTYDTWAEAYDLASHMDPDEWHTYIINTETGQKVWDSEW